MAYSELVKSFERIRNYMREFYVYGFKSRDEYGMKSARSYDNERRRIESWLGDYMSFHQESSGKNVFLSLDSRRVPRNPLYKAFKAKSFTDKDITLHFYILDILADGSVLSSKEIVDRINDDYLSHFNGDFSLDESIQIGAIKLNQALEVLDSFNERIAPQYYTELHPKVAEITKLSNRDLQKGKGFHTVFDSFCDWCGDDFVFLVWGTEDLRILRKNMDLHNIDTSFMPPCFNLQNIFVDQVTHDTKQYALANALAIVGEVPFDSHDALNDARSAALLCIHLGLIRGLNEYKETVENRNGIVESYEFEEPYADIGDALSDDYVVSFECPHCGEIVWGENWIRKTGTNLLSLSQCSDGQEYLISLKFRPIAENKVVVKRLVYALTDELRTDYQQCMEQAAAWSKYVIPAYSF